MNFIAFFKVKYIISMTVILIKTRIKNKRNKIFLLLNKSQGLKKSYYLCMYSVYLYIHINHVNMPI